MATTLTTPGNLAEQLDFIGDALKQHARALRNEDDRWKRMLDDGVAPLTVKERMDMIMLAYVNYMLALGRELGIDTVYSGATVNDGDDLIILPKIPCKFATQWRFGAPNALGSIVTGSNNTRTFFNSGVDQGIRLISYLDVGPNYDMFLGLKANDVIDIANCSVKTHNGRYGLLYDVAAKGASLSNPAAVATYGPNDASDTFYEGDFRNAYADGNWVRSTTEWAIAGGSGAVFTAAGAGAPTLTHVLAGMTAGAAYVIQFTLAVTDITPTGTLRVSIGGDYYWEIAIDTIQAATAYSFVTNAPSATPTLTFTATASGASTAFTIDDVIVYGYQGLVLSDTFAEPADDDTTIITLCETAA